MGKKCRKIIISLWCWKTFSVTQNINRKKSKEVLKLEQNIYSYHLYGQLHVCPFFDPWTSVDQWSVDKHVFVLHESEAAATWLNQHSQILVPYQPISLFTSHRSTACLPNIDWKTHPLAMNYLFSPNNIFFLNPAV